ncbi:MAG: hypothetical protein DRP02_05940 [Candidatus Gerdarchaeota archaeon]|nr:MAG: hypothetical protein DRO63_06490 [Candidatus Gerdarchaeota archaeon]RLI71048.1 MAG: hypothetical protein DRP02_05940 [Candidatus Gerdarchaeota archaeon]
MSKESIIKRFLGTSRYMAKLTFAPNRKNYSPKMKVEIEIFDGSNSEGQFKCNSIAEVAQKITAFYEERTGMELETRRLARWFIEYLQEAGIKEPDLYTLLKDLQSTPEEIEAREGLTEQ